MSVSWQNQSKVKSCIAVNGTPYPSHSYGVSLAIWDHTVLPATRCKRTHPAFTPARQAGVKAGCERGERLVQIAVIGAHIRSKLA